MRISGYRLMWLMVMFDLPVLTKEDRREYRRFVDRLEDDGYTRLQYSVYVRPCATEENTAVHFARISDRLPPAGEVRILKFTDKQWARMALFREAKRAGVEEPPEQLTFFDEDGEPLESVAAIAEVTHRVAIQATEAKPPAAYVAEPPRPSYGEATKPKKRRSRKVDSATPSFDFFD